MEIEKKFLVASDRWRELSSKSDHIVQFYLTGLDHEPTVRLRKKGDRGYLTLKYSSCSTDTLIREEYEYQIPAEDVDAQMGKATGLVIEKIRHYVATPDDHVWEIDEFKGAHEGLIIAEIELTDQDDSFELPDWIGEDVTADSRYSNLVLSFSRVTPE
ncbi:CYTH domain-containing protein [Sneathiella chinensis]|uniref:Adenylate cyclase n=1 Tax=Sneathiella chinensis TaxID=349750 RepID=A0ABQ5U6X8_9PROT|nr:CYTH domain-containing protein [Sneathiella chinensis]GLQ07894.1 adenylate cyclase [Sneathiella chinensis]